MFDPTRALVVPEHVAIECDHDTAAKWLGYAISDGDVVLKAREPYRILFVPWVANRSGLRSAYRLLRDKRLHTAIFAVRLDNKFLVPWSKKLHRTVFGRRFEIVGFKHANWPGEIRLCMHLIA